MKFIWLSVAPWAVTGYGLVTKELVPRIAKEGHEVIIATKHGHTGCVKWNGLDVIAGTDMNLLNRMVKGGGVDYIISLLDNHILGQTPLNWISYCPFDTEKLPHSIERYLEHTKLIIALTRHGQDEFKKAGYESLYVPHGVDPEIYKPDEVSRKENRKRLEWEDNFIIGTVGVNYSDNRKNFVNLIWAFKVFQERHPKTRFYMATNHVDDKGAYPIPMIAESLGIVDFMALTSDDEYITGKITDTMMANRYRMMDVMCMPTKGEGFGLPIIEAQACGTPVVTTNASTGPELLKGGWLIDVGEYEWEYFNKSWRANVGVESILDALEKAYSAWEDGSIKEVGLHASEVIRRDYNWDFIFDTYFIPVLKEIEGLKTKVKSIPNYKKLYQSFNGRITMSDCGQWCSVPCDINFPLLPEEPETKRPTLSRSYPILPNEDGELFVDTNCPLHKWLAKSFVIDAKRILGELWGHPVVRRHFEHSTLPQSYVLLDSIKIDFDDSYKWAMQSKYHTVYPDLKPYIDIIDCVLDVGCGDGRLIKKLREQGVVDTFGVEVNEAWIGEIPGIFKGDVEKRLPFRDRQFDIVISIDVLEHLDNPLKGLSEMFRVSKDRVIVFLTPVEMPDFWQDPTHKVEWDIERWKREINEFGEIIEVIKPCGFMIKKREIHAT